jgi:hypothetical protein
MQHQGLQIEVQVAAAVVAAALGHSDMAEQAVPA